MNNRSETIRKIESMLSDVGYPSAFLEQYDQLECFASHKGRETFLVRRKSDGGLAVAKCFDRTLFDVSREAELLKNLDHDGLPRFLDCFDNEKMSCIVREYIEGTPLDVYAANNDLTREQIVDLCVSLADILIYLHGRTPPVIHRDVKPENVVVRPDGCVSLIDFDIARTYKNASGTDTMFFGTKGYASPEQYGFKQTDSRTDIYSFGVLLRYLLTNSTRASRNVSLYPPLQRVIDRCTAFSPEQRYADMETVRRDLLAARKKKLPAGRIALMLAALILTLAAGFAMGRYTNVLNPAPIQFVDPTIEKAVRTQLGVGQQTPLTKEDLGKVDRLYIFGDNCYRNGDGYYDQDVADWPRGSISTLDDVALLPNLGELHIIHQGDVDISALGKAASLYCVELKHMWISDVSVLSKLPELKHVMLFCAGLEDVTALQVCKKLETLDVGLNYMTGMDQIGVYPYLKTITLKWLKMDSLDGIEQMPHLTSIYLDDAEIGDYSALLKLTELERVYAGDGNIEELTQMFEGTDVEVLRP